jgi:hypothetical protein
MVRRWAVARRRNAVRYAALFVLVSCVLARSSLASDLEAIEAIDVVARSRQEARR